MDKRKPLDRAVITEAALALVDQEGLEALSMRRLGARLGVEAMTLYHHVANKEALLDLMVARVAMESAGGDSAAPGWRAGLEDFARRYRAALLRRPRLLPLIVGRPVRSPDAMAVFFAAIVRLQAAGFTARDAYFALNALAFLVIGQALAEVGQPASSVGGSAEDRYRAELAQLTGQAGAVHEDIFSFALAVFFDGLEARLAASGEAVLC